MKNFSFQLLNKPTLQVNSGLRQICEIPNLSFLFLFLICGHTAFSQSGGDYRSNTAVMNWSLSTGWQKFDGTSWVTATDYPGQNSCSNCTITIQNSNIVTLNISPANSVGNIIIGSGTSGTLTLDTFSLTNTGDLTVNTGAMLNLATGSLHIAGNTITSGTITDASNTGSNIFNGTVIKNGGSWVSTAVSSAANMVFKTGFTNNAGSFTAGAATMADSAVLIAVSAMEFKGIVTSAGALTIDGPGGVVFSGSLNVGGDLSITTAGSLSLASTGYITVSGATTINGSFTDTYNTGINTFTKLVTNKGIFNTDSVSSAANIRFNGGFLNETGAVCHITSARLSGSITGSSPIIMDGIVTNSGAVTIAGGTVNIAGADNVVFTSPLTVNSGATFIISTTGSFTAPATINAGSITDTDNSSTTIFTGLFTNSGITDFSALSKANIIFNSGLVHTSGTFNVPAATIATNYTGNDITATSPINFTGGVNFTGTGALSITGAGGVTFSGTEDITVPAALQLAALSSITVSTTGNFTVATTSGLAGSFTDNENTGITTFTGLVTKSNGAWNSVAVITAGNMLFKAGITQTGGTFNAGAASLPDNSTLKSTPVMTFNNPLAIGGNGNITIAGTGGVVLAGIGINHLIPGNLLLTGLLTVSTTGNFKVAGTTSITGTGGFTDNENTGISTFKGIVTHNSTGKWTTTAVTNPANLVFNESITNTTGAFAAGAATIADNKTLKGTVNMSFANGLSVTGNGDITIAGTATNGVSFGGTLINYVVRNLSISGKLTVSTTGNFVASGTTTLTGTGNFTDNNNTGSTTFTGLITVGSTATFTTTAVNTIGKLIIAGGIVQNNTTAGAFVTGALRTSATQNWSGAGNISTTGILDVNAGTLSNNITGTVTAGSSLTGIGTTWVQGTNAKLSLNSSNPFTISTLTSSTTGNTIIYGSLTNATVKAQPYFNLTIAGTNTKIAPSADLTVNGSLTINSGIFSSVASGRNIFVAGNWINNAGAGGYDPGAGNVTFNGTSKQTLGGTAATTFKNVTINNVAGIIQTANCKINGLLNIVKGNITTGDNSVNISNTGAVVRTGGYIVGKEQINFTTGSNIAKTFDVGDSAVYAPVYLILSNVTTSGDVTVKTTATDQPFIGSSLLNGNRSVNRYWSITNNSAVLSSYTAVLNFTLADKDTAFNTANLTAGVFDTGWTYPAMGVKTATTAQVTGIRNFGDISLAERKICTPPNVLISNPPAVCLPATADLTMPSITEGSDTGLIYTYWTNAAATTLLPLPQSAGAGIFYIKGTLNDGSCSIIKTVAVTKMNPTAAIDGTNTICTGENSLLNLIFTGTAPWSGTLSNGTAYQSNNNTLTVTVTPAASSDYTVVTLADASGCAAQSSDKTGLASVTIIQPATPADAGPDQEICGEFVTLAADTPVSGTGTWSIVSGSGGWFSDSTSDVADFYGIPGEKYVLRWSVTNAICPASTDDVTIKFTSGLWTGATDSTWTNAANWCSGMVPAGIINLALPAGLKNYPVINDSVTVNDLYLGSGASIKINGVLTIKGSCQNSGTLSNTGTIILAGVQRQNFPGAGTITAMKNLTFNTDSGIVINKSFTLTGTLSSLSGTADLDDKLITLRSDASGTAAVSSVKGKFAYTRGGKFVVQRYVPAKKAWRLITAPVTSSNSIFSSWQNNRSGLPGAGTFILGPAGGNGLDGSGNSTLKLFDTATQALVPVTTTYAPVSPGSLGNGDNAGYFIFIQGDRSAFGASQPATATTLSSAGKLQTGNQIMHTDYTAGKFTLVGNPYASPVDFGALEKTNIINRFYAWDPNLNQVGGYTVLDDIDNDGNYSTSIASGKQTKIIASQQAIFVQTIKNAYGSLIFHEANKYDSIALTGGRPAGIQESIDAELYLLNADSTTMLADGAKMEFNDNFSNDVNMEDAVKFANVNENFSWTRSNTDLAIERRRPVTELDTLFLKLTKSTQRSYQLRLTANNMDTHDLEAILVDKYLGKDTIISLNGSSKINFSITSDTASSSNNRFKIIFKPTNHNVNFVSIKGHKTNNIITINWMVEKERGIEKYEVETGFDGVRFTSINTTLATGNNNSTVSYSFADTRFSAGNNFYRIKSTDLGGKNTYSGVVMVKTGIIIPAITVYPNPVQNNTINLQFLNQPKGIYTISLTAVGNGRRIFTKQISVSPGNSQVPVAMPQKLSKGIYNCKVKAPDDTETLHEIIVE